MTCKSSPVKPDIERESGHGPGPETVEHGVVTVALQGRVIVQTL